MNELNKLTEIQYRKDDILILFENVAIAIEEISPYTEIYKFTCFRIEHAIIETENVIKVVRYYEIKDKELCDELKTCFLEKWFDHITNTLIKHTRSKQNSLDKRTEQLKIRLNLI